LQDQSLRLLKTNSNGVRSCNNTFLKNGGYTPKHSHLYEHEVFILNGKGRVFTDNTNKDIEKNYFLYVPPDKEHQFINTGENDLEFLCIIPNKK